MKYIKNFIYAVIILNCVKSLLSNLITGDSEILETKFNDNLVRSKRITRTANYKLQYIIVEDHVERITKTMLHIFNVVYAMKNIERQSCITFSPTNVFTNNQTKLAIKFVSDKFKKPERVFFKYIPFYLSKTCSQSYNCVFLELFYYLTNSLEQNRSDRDEYLNVYKENIDESKEGCSKKYKRDEFNLTLLDVTSFDYGSYTLAKRNECSINGKNTIEAKHYFFNNMIGQRYHPSFNDWKLLNELYCKNRCNQPIFCDHDSYPNYNKCNRHCVCPNGFEGKNCSEIINLREDYWIQHFTAKKEETLLHIKGIHDITLLLQANSSQTMKLHIQSVSTPKAEPCFEKKGLQIKYAKDKGSTGLCLCGDYKNITLYSEDHEVLVQFYSTQKSHHLELTFKLK